MVPRRLLMRVRLFAKLFITFDLGSLAVVPGLLSAHGAAPAANLERHWNFDIVSGSLESALMQFSRQTRIQVIVGPQVPDSLVSGIRGRLSAREVLHQLLEPVGLDYTVIGNTVTVHTVRN
jgi:hypothetical protein